MSSMFWTCLRGPPPLTRDAFHAVTPTAALLQHYLLPSALHGIRLSVGLYVTLTVGKKMARLLSKDAEESWDVMIWKLRARSSTRAVFLFVDQPMYCAAHWLGAHAAKVVACWALLGDGLSIGTLRSLQDAAVSGIRSSLSSVASVGSLFSAAATGGGSGLSGLLTAVSSATLNWVKSSTPSSVAVSNAATASGSSGVTVGAVAAGVSGDFPSWQHTLLFHNSSLVSRFLWFIPNGTRVRLEHAFVSSVERASTPMQQLTYYNAHWAGIRLSKFLYCMYEHAVGHHSHSLTYDLYHAVAHMIMDRLALNLSAQIATLIGWNGGDVRFAFMSVVLLSVAEGFHDRFAERFVFKPPDATMNEAMAMAVTDEALRETFLTDIVLSLRRLERSDLDKLLALCQNFVDISDFPHSERIEVLRFYRVVYCYSLAIDQGDVPATSGVDLAKVSRALGLSDFGVEAEQQSSQFSDTSTSGKSHHCSDDSADNDTSQGKGEAKEEKRMHHPTCAVCLEEVAPPPHLFSPNTAPPVCVEAEQPQPQPQLMQQRSDTSHDCTNQDKVQEGQGDTGITTPPPRPSQPHHCSDDSDNEKAQGEGEAKEEKRMLHPTCAVCLEEVAPPPHLLSLSTASPANDSEATERPNGDRNANPSTSSSSSNESASAALVAARSAAVALLCGHVFHERCISEWIEGHTHCPTCRLDLRRATRKPPSDHKRESRTKSGVSERQNDKNVNDHDSGNDDDRDDSERHSKEDDHGDSLDGESEEGDGDDEASRARAIAAVFQEQLVSLLGTRTLPARLEHGEWADVVRYCDQHCILDRTRLLLPEIEASTRLDDLAISTVLTLTGSYLGEMF